MMQSRYWRRSLTDKLVVGLAGGATLVVLVPLAAIFGYLIYRGIGSLDWNFLTKIPKPPGESGGGMANAIGGSGLILLIASVIGVPMGIGTGIYLAEFGKKRFGYMVRFTADVLNGVPSIVIGLVAYSLVVLPMKGYSALAGGVALGIMMVPIISRSTEEMLLMVPQSLREAAWGLGIPQWRTTLSITLRTASSGIVTAIMLSFARVAGETAPLIFTAFGNMYWNRNIMQPTAALPLQIYVFSQSPYDEQVRLAWAGSLILIILIIVSITLVRWAASRGVFKGGN
jgi:phosphate transport system permease protein